MDIKNELIKRYSYLYENKELILAMCINTVIVKDSSNKRIKELEKIKKKCERLYTDDIVKSITSIIDSIKKGDDRLVYYLFKDVNDEIVDLYEDFLFGDKEIEELDLYKHIEGVKNNPIYLELFNDMIVSLEERRKCKLHLKKIPTFTVWKILSYVRRRYSNNITVLKALDKYYNIDRYMLTGYDFKSGYYLLEEDKESDEKLNSYPSSILVDGVYGSYILDCYKGNKYEEEDEYFAFDDEKLVNEDYTTSVLMMLLKDLPMIDIDSKKMLYMKYNYNRDKKLVRKRC